MSYRIVIRAHTARRDVAAAALLAAILEKRGCKTMVTCVRNHIRAITMWKPHCIVSMVPGKSSKDLLPEAYAVYWETEGYIGDDLTNGQYFFQNPGIFNSFDLFLIWGNYFEKDLENNIPDLNKSIVKKVGCGKFDFIKFSPSLPLKKSEPRNSVGIITRFTTINHHESIPAIRNLHNKSTYDYVVNCCHSYYHLYKVIEEIIEQTELNISIRPHPMEDIAIYKEKIIPSFGLKNIHRFSIDPTMEISDWIPNQRVIIGSTSTAFVETYLMGVPFINIDRLSGTQKYNAEWASVCRIWQESAYLPNSIDDCLSLIKSVEPLEVKSAAMDKQINTYFNWGADFSATYKAAEELVKFLDVNKTHDLKGWPEWVVDSIDEISFRRARIRNPMHVNFNYRKGYHGLPESMGHVTEAIWEKYSHK